MSDYQKAIKAPEKFKRGKPIQARAYKLLDDAYAESGKIRTPWTIIKKRHIILKKMKPIQPNIFYGGLFCRPGAERTKEAIALYKELKENFQTR